MTDSGGDVEGEARRLLDGFARPRRRIRPRVSRALADATDVSLKTAYGEIAAWRLGHGPAVLLVHGWEDDNALWGPAVDQFAAWGRSVVALDLPGHGLSPCEDASVDSAAAALIAVAAEIGPIHAAVGHSYGCAAIIRALSQGLAVDRVALIATPTPRTHPRRPLHIDDIDPAVLARVDAIRAERTAEDTRVVEAAIAGMTARCLAVHSIDDEQCPLENSQRLAQLWPGADLMLTDGLGHRFVAQDSDVLERIAEFVEAP